MRKDFRLLALVLLIVSMTGFTSAAGPLDDIDRFIDSTIDFFENTKLVPAILGDTPDGELLFAKVLFFAIILSIVFLTLGRIELFESKPSVLWVVSIAASILSIRFISDDNIISSIILPYSTLGIAISAALPFIVYFMVVELGMPGPRNKTFRKIAWIFFAVIFIGLWISRDVPVDSENAWAYWIYPITAALSLIMLNMDGTIQRWRAKMRTEKATSHRHQEEIYRLEDMIRAKTKRFADGGYEGHGGETEYEKEVKTLRTRIARIQGT